jgi:hypothetical protein
MLHKSVWIINDYAGSPSHGMEYRHYYLGKELVKLGYCVTIISASYSHLFKRQPNVTGDFTHEKIDGINFLWVKVNDYGKSHDKRRVLKWLLFSYRLLKLPVSELIRPDLIVVSPMAVFPILPAYRWAKKMDSRLAFEVKDIWPLSLMEIGGYSSNHPFIMFMRWFEYFALKNADVIISNLPNYGQYIKDSGFDRNFTYIPNGVDLAEVRYPQKLDDDIASQLENNKFVVGYVGTVGAANALQSLLEAAKLLVNNSDIVFVIVGDGQEKKRLMELSVNIPNVLFLPAIPKVQVQSMLAFFDICYIGLKKEKLFEYGVSPNKIFDYMYSGKPILHSISTKKGLVARASCGVSVEAENPRAIAGGVFKLFSLSDSERELLGENGKQYVIEHHTYDKLALKYKCIIEKNEIIEIK